MILIAALAAGFGVARALGSQWGTATVHTTQWAAISLLSMCYPSLVALTLAFIAIRLRKPRPGRRRFACQPGFVACGTMALILGVTPPFALASLLKTTASLGEMLLALYCVLVPAIAGIVVLAAWALLAISGRWRRERGWIDLLGIQIGLGWILMSVLSLYVFT